MLYDPFSLLLFLPLLLNKYVIISDFPFSFWFSAVLLGVGVFILFHLFFWKIIYHYVFKYDFCSSVFLSLDLFSLSSSSFFCFSSLIFRTPLKEVKVKSLSHLCLFATPWIVAYQASPSMGFSRQEYWSGLPFPSPGDLTDPRIEHGSPALQADAFTI